MIIVIALCLGFLGFLAITMQLMCLAQRDGITLPFLTWVILVAFTCSVARGIYKMWKGIACKR